MRTKVFRWGAWLLLLAAASFTLSPINLRPVTGVPADTERFVAFAAIGFAFSFGYPRHRLASVAFTVAIAGMLEVLQHIVPGRHGYVHDYLLKALGAAIGAGIAAASQKAIARWRGFTHY